MPFSFAPLLLLIGLGAGLGAGWLLRAKLQRSPPMQQQAPDPRLAALESELHQAQRVIAGLKSARPAFLSASDRDPVDDYSVIRGISDSEQRMLHNLGVRSYAQLAQLNPDDVAYVASRMELNPSRIEQERWVEQAQTLAQLRGQLLG